MADVSLAVMSSLSEIVVVIVITIKPLGILKPQSNGPIVQQYGDRYTGR